MKNIMEINGYWAIVNYDPEIAMYRGEFAGLNGAGQISTPPISMDSSEKARFR